MGLPLQIIVKPSAGVPIYRQVVEQIKALAASGQIQAGQLLPGVRQVAADLGVNPMTISRAYSMLEAEGIVERVRGTGMRITDAAAGLSLRRRQQQLRDVIEPAIERARQLGLTEEQIVAVVRAALREPRHQPAQP